MMKSLWMILFSLTIILRSCASMVDVALMAFVYKNDSSTLLTESSAIFDIAEADLRKMYASVMNITRVQVLDDDSTCLAAEQRSTFLASRYYYREVPRNASVGMFFSAPCSTSSGPVSDLAREWNVPIFIPTEANWGISADVTRFPTRIRLSSPNWMDFLYRFLKEFGYTSVAFLCTDDILSRSTCRYLHRMFFLQKRLYEIEFADIWIQKRDSSSFYDSLEELRSSTRVIVIVAPDQSIRRIMLTAFKKGMTDGSFVYLTFDGYNRNRPAFLSAKTDERIEDALTAFRSLFTISYNIQNTSEYREFTNKVMRLSAEKYGKTYGAEEEIDLRAMFNYHALAIHGQVLNESITNGWNLTDGAGLVKLVKNRTFSILGSEIVIDSNGDRQSNWVLNQMDPIAGMYRPVLTDTNGGKSLQPFRDPTDKSVHPIVWYNRTGPPPNVQHPSRSHTTWIGW